MTSAVADGVGDGPADGATDGAADGAADGANDRAAHGTADGEGVADHPEPHDSSGQRLNWLRAAVLGSNDGIVSTAGVIAGVAGATTDRAPILTAGIAALVAGALSMATGEYVSVSTQRDTERALIAEERRELREMPEQELEELASLYRDRGLDADLAHEVAVQLTAKDALAAHAEVELQIDVDDLTNPWSAALASMASFTVGALLPLVAVLVSSPSWRLPVVALFVVLALALTGWTSARLGARHPGRQVLRNVVGGVLAVLVTYAIGRLVGTAI